LKRKEKGLIARIRKVKVMIEREKEGKGEGRNGRNGIEMERG